MFSKSGLRLRLDLELHFFSGLAVSIILSIDDDVMQVSCDSVSARAASVDGLDVH